MKPIAEESKAKVIAVYDAAAATYNRVGPSFFLHFGRRLACGVEIAPSSKVQDVATGTGAVLVPAAELVGDEGRVIGIDISCPSRKAHPALNYLQLERSSSTRERSGGEGESPRNISSRWVASSLPTSRILSAIGLALW